MNQLREQVEPRSPFGLAIGLLAACGMTLISLFCGHTPEIILYRAGVGGVVVTIVSSIMISVISMIFIEDDE